MNIILIYCVTIISNDRSTNYNKGRLLCKIIHLLFMVIYQYEKSVIVVITGALPRETFSQLFQLLSLMLDIIQGLYLSRLETFKYDLNSVT